MKKIFNFLKILGLILLCFSIAFLIVWPLWKFAVTTPKIYTWIITALILILLIFFIIRKIAAKLKK